MLAYKTPIASPFWATTSFGILAQHVDFIGTCTNARRSELIVASEKVSTIVLL
jgi:homoaconitase/3-isopropylmalate dehydratase large subunit